MPSRHELARLIEAPQAFLGSPDPVLRRMAVTAIEPEVAAEYRSALRSLTTDAEPEVRAAVAEKLGSMGDAGLEDLSTLRSDADERVREAAATAYGEIGDPAAVGWLVLAANDDPDRAVREAAVAALGSIGDPEAIDPLLALMREAPPQVRRRAIAAITVFDDDRIEPAIRLAALDRNPGVREAAEMVVGRQLSADG